MRQKVPFVDNAALVSSQYQNFRWKWSRKKTCFSVYQVFGVKATTSFKGAYSLTQVT